MPATGTGGVVALPMWQGPPSTLPSAFSSTRCPWAYCTLPNVTTAAFSPVAIQCEVPPGVGVGFHILLRNAWIPLPAAAGYDVPHVLYVLPSRMPILGGTIVLHGRGFFLNPAPPVCTGQPVASTVQLLVTQPPAGSSVMTRFPENGTWVPPVDVLLKQWTTCNVTSWLPDAITCTVPPGLDATPTVRVTVGGNSSVTVGLVGFSPPVLDALIVPDGFGTPGGVDVTLMGAQLPLAPWPLAVTVGPWPCPVYEDRRSATSVVCRLPTGTGTVRVAVHTPLQSTVYRDALVYPGPSLSAVVAPNGCPVDGGFPLVVTGEVRWCALDSAAVYSSLMDGGAGALRCHVQTCVPNPTLCRTSMTVA